MRKKGIKGIHEIINRRQNTPIGMIYLQLLRKLLMNKWRLAVRNRVTKNGIGFHRITLSKQLARQGITNFRRIQASSRFLNNGEIRAKLRPYFFDRAAGGNPVKFALVETNGLP